MHAAEKFQVLEGHNSDVTGCDFFGFNLATCSADKSIKVWTKESKYFKETDFSPLLDHTYGVNCVRFSPFGTLLASCSTDGKVILWNAQDGEKVCELQHLSGSPIRVCCFSPTSAVLATGGDDEKVVLWDLATKCLLRVLEGHEAMITTLAFSPDSSFLISCSTAGDIMLWDARYGHGKCLSSVPDAHDLGILGCDFSPQYDAVSEGGFINANYIISTCGNDDLVKLWCIKTVSIKNITLLMKLEGHSGNVMSCRFSHDGTLLASTGGDRCVILWNPANGQALQKLEGHNRYVTCCAFSDSILMASGSNDKTVVIWSLDKDKLLKSAAEKTAEKEKKFIMDEKKQNILIWTVEDVLNWLKSLNLEHLNETFHSNAIDGKELIHLNHEILLTVLKIESLGVRNKILRAVQCLKNPLWQHVFSDSNEEGILSEFYCPITQEVMRNPVVAADGYSYEKCAIQEWLESGRDTSPMTNET
ncbi:WD repeat, SAM and U-box domain-containing protein 1, partial [Stegodyphus mimosarum]